MEDVVHSAHRALERGLVADVTDVELNLPCDIRILRLVLVAHVVLLLFVTREDADLLYVCLKESLKDGIAKATGSPGNHKCFVFEDGHIVV